jgi:integrase
MSKTTWERTSVQNLLRNGESGRYFGRWTVSGKQIWVKLETDVFSVAKLRLADEAAKIESRRRSANSVTAGKGTVGDLMVTYEDLTKSNSELKPSSITARLVALKKVKKTWPELAAMKPLDVSTAAVEAWATRFKGNGTNFTPPGAKTAIKGNSATSVNRAIDTVRRLMDLAIESGSIHRNPVTIAAAKARARGSGRLKKKLVRVKYTPPKDADVQRIFSAIENNGAVGGWGAEAADFCRFLAFSGCRVGEVPGVTWACVDWEKKTLRIRGVEPVNPNHNALKSESSDRVIPLFAQLESLLKRIVERREKAAVYSETGKPATEPTDRVFRLSEAQKSLDAACASLTLPRLTHHDFRHLFATKCIEAGVDFRTIAEWLGHADGGVLVMSTYGHLRQEHSQAQAAKVTFQ